jgi:hypothetical protein
MTEQDIHARSGVGSTERLERSVGFADAPLDRQDDRNDELDESPVPDPEERDGDAEDDPSAD